MRNITHILSRSFLALLTCFVAGGVAVGQALLPSDINMVSLSRFAPISVSALSAEKKKLYDEAYARNGVSLGGINGPGAIRLHGSSANWHNSPVAEGLSDDLRQIAILVAAREMDSVYEWSLHEPMALKAGVSAHLVDALRNRSAIPANLPKKHAEAAMMGRELFRNHALSIESFARAKAVLGETDMVDITLVMANYAGTGLLIHMADMRLPKEKQKPFPK